MIPPSISRGMVVIMISILIKGCIWSLSRFQPYLPPTTAPPPPCAMHQSSSQLPRPSSAPSASRDVLPVVPVVPVPAAAMWSLCLCWRPPPRDACIVPVQGALRRVLPVLAAATCTRPCPCRTPPHDVEQINIPLLIIIFLILLLYYLYYLDILPHTTDQCFSGIDKSQPSDVYIWVLFR